MDACHGTARLHMPTAPFSVIGAHYAGLPGPARVLARQSSQEVRGDHPLLQPWAARRVLPRADGSRRCGGNDRNFRQTGKGREGVYVYVYIRIASVYVLCVNMSVNGITTLPETCKGEGSRDFKGPRMYFFSFLSFFLLTKKFLFFFFIKKIEIYKNKHCMQHGGSRSW